MPSTAVGTGRIVFGPVTRCMGVPSSTSDTACFIFTLVGSVIKFLAFVALFDLGRGMGLFNSVVKVVHVESLS